jgi:hypothetical protein
VLSADNTLRERQRRFLVTFCRLTKVTRWPQDSGSFVVSQNQELDSSFRWNDKRNDVGNAP